MAAFSPRPFEIRVEDSILEDLRHRLQRARVDRKNIDDAGYDSNDAWAYGTDRATLDKYVEHWLHQFDWKSHERALNAVPHFTGKLQCPLSSKALDVHFIHAKSQIPDAIPLLLVHGWPGSVFEFLKLIPLLTAQGFDVVAPSIPGYGWSEAPSVPGAGVSYMADQLHALMIALGYQQYGAQGGDWGAMITTRIAKQYPRSCVALHLNFCIYQPSDWYSRLKALAGMPFMSQEEKAALKSTMHFVKYETGYQQIQGTKPQSLSFGLNDSPVGLLAWHLEKFQSWSDCGQGPPEASGLTKDEILANVMIYWVTQSIGTSMRIYYETLGLHPKGRPPSFGGYVAVPTGILWSHVELVKIPRHVATTGFNVKQWTVPEKGGHFFAFEQPQAMAVDIVKFFKGAVDFEECKRTAPRKGQGPGFQPGRYLVLAGLLGGGACAAMRVWRSRL